MDKILLTIPGAADRLSIGRSKLYELVRSGEVPTVRIGRSVRIATAEIDRFAARLQAEAEADAGR